MTALRYSKDNINKQKFEVFEKIFMTLIEYTVLL